MKFGRNSTTSTLTTSRANSISKIILTNSTSSSHFQPMRNRTLMISFSKSNSSTYNHNKKEKKNKKRKILRSQGG